MHCGCNTVQIMYHVPKHGLFSVSSPCGFFMAYTGYYTTSFSPVHPPPQGITVGAGDFLNNKDPLHASCWLVLSGAP